MSIALHGTNDFTPELMRKCINSGAVKLNVNKLILESWDKHLKDNIEVPYSRRTDEGMQVLQDEVERWMDICGSSRKA